MHWVQVVVVGIAGGCLYALPGLGLVLTYKATGVFNFAHFTIALFAAYVAWQLNGVWGWPLWIAAPVVLFAVGPITGLLLERVVFRPLQRRRASTTEKLVAALGVTVLGLALVNIIWGPEVQGTTTEPVPRVFGARPLIVGDVRFSSDQLGFAITVVVVSVLLYALFRYTFLGTKLRAVVDRRELAELSGIDANRVSAVAWAIGCGVAALTGMLIGPPVLEPHRIIFFAIETFSVAVVARLVSLPMAAAAGILLLGVVPAVMNQFEPFGTTGSIARTWESLITNFSVIVLFAALLLYRKLDEVGDTGTTAQGIVTASFGRRAGRPAPMALAFGGLALGLALVLPMTVGEIGMQYLQQILAFTVIFTSIVVITGFSGHITLGQASIAGLGAFFTARAINGLDVPVVVGMVIGSGAAMLAGIVAGYPALRRKGLFLGLTTLSLGLLIDRFVFQTVIFSGGGSGLVVHRPSFASTTTGFYYFALVITLLMLVLARNLRSGRLGRILGAMRDSETATKSVGIDLRRFKLFIFAASAFMAGIGGAMLSMSQGAWDVNTFLPIYSLFWFIVVIVAGVSSIGGAVGAAVAYVMLPVLLDTDPRSAVFVFGLLSIALVRFPGGIAANLHRIPASIARRGVHALHAARAARNEGVSAVETSPEYELSPLAETALADAEVKVG
jgi:branched-chain amino acid transport system permease protein